MSSLLVTGLAALLVLLLTLPAWVLFVQVRAAVGARTPSTVLDPATGAPDRPPVGIVIPAHNESSGIRATLLSILPQLQAQDVVWVVADNCSDDTAAQAAACGPQVRVTERQHDTERGKGYALAHGVRTLRAQTPRDWVVLMDADCQLGERALDRLVRACVASGRPVQALYLMDLPAGVPHGWRQHLAAFAWRVRNWVRPRGGHAMGWGCQLMGTGMALPAGLLREELLANGHITEDMRLGIDLALEGHAPMFLEGARVTSEFPVSTAASKTQRTRWEHGHLDMMRQGAPRLWSAGLARRDRRLVGMALDLCVPPLALVAGLQGLGWLLSAALALAGGSLLPLWLASLGLALMTVAIARAWRHWGRDVMPGRELLMVPLFILGKIPLYLGFLLRKQTRWIRTERR